MSQERVRLDAIIRSTLRQRKAAERVGEEIRLVPIDPEEDETEQSDQNPESDQNE